VHKLKILTKPTFYTMNRLKKFLLIDENYILFDE